MSPTDWLGPPVDLGAALQGLAEARRAANRPNGVRPADVRAGADAAHHARQGLGARPRNAGPGEHPLAPLPAALLPLAQRLGGRHRGRGLRRVLGMPSVCVLLARVLCQDFL